MLVIIGLIVFISLLVFLGHYNFWRPTRNPFWPRILMYHNTANAPGNGMNIAPSAFERQVQYLLKKKYAFLKVSDLHNFKEPQRHLALTFDDGFASNYTNLFPILKKYNIPATIYLTPNIAGIEVLTAQQIQEMQASGLIEFGAHTMTHINLTKVADQVAEQEILGSKTAVEALTSAPCVTFAYPYGRFDTRHAEMIKNAGFTSAVTTKKAILPFAQENAYTLPRLSINGSINWLQFYLILTRGRHKL